MRAPGAPRPARALPESGESGRGFGLNEADEDAVVDVLDAEADHARVVLAKNDLSQTGLDLCLFHANRPRGGSHRSGLAQCGVGVRDGGGGGGLKRRGRGDEGEEAGYREIVELMNQGFFRVKTIRFHFAQICL